VKRPVVSGVVVTITRRTLRAHGAYLDGANLARANLDGANLARAYRPSVSWGYSDLPDGWERDESGCLRRPAKEPAR
jgi:hypothetical protein